MTSSPRPADQTAARLLWLGLGLVALWTAVFQVEPASLSLLPCPVRSVTGVSCPGCGMTRASISLLHGDVASALRFHPFVFLLLPLTAAWALSAQRSSLLWRRLPRPVRRGTMAILLGACLALWIVRVT